MKHRTFPSVRHGAPRRRRGRTRLFVLGAAFAASSIVVPPASARPPAPSGQEPAVPRDPPGARVLRFDIGEAPIRDTLKEYERVTGIRVALADPALGVIQSPGVIGSFTPAQAMDRLLMGTSLAAAVDSGGAVKVSLAHVSAHVDVKARGATVASPKLTGPLRDIPQTISVIPRAVIQEQGAATLRDVLRNVPGITFQAGEGGGGLPGDNLTLRGFSAANDMFVDGLRDAGGYSRDAFNLEQLEVLKGPSSAIAGRGATGGVINQVTKSPHSRPAYSGSIGLGSADYRRGTVDFNQPLGEETGSAVRVSAMWTDTGVPGRNVVQNRSWGVAPSLAVGLQSATQFIVKYQHVAQDNVPDYGLPWGSSPGFPTGAFQADPPVDQSLFYGLRDYDFEDIRSDIVTADVGHRFGNALSLRSITRYGDTDRDSAITAPRPPNRQLQRRTMGTGMVANQTDVTFGIGTHRRHDVVAGLEVSRETTENQNSAQTVNQPSITVFDPDPNERPLGAMPPNTGNPSKTSLDLAGAYVFDTWHPGERWEASGGVRWDIVDVRYSQRALATGETSRIQSSDAMLSWRGGLVFKPAMSASLYAGYGTSFNPSVDAAATGAALSAAETAANNPTLRPEQTRNVEVGAKWDALDERLSLNAALFHTSKVNARTRNAVGEPFVLSGEQRVRGVEIGASGAITPRWSALVGYAYMNSEILQSANPAEEGQNLTLTPRRTFNAWTTFRLPWEVTIGGGAQYMDAVFRNTTNSLTVPGYWIVNGLASRRFSEYLTLRINGHNLADAQYVDRIGGGHYIPGPRRQLTLNADVGF